MLVTANTIGQQLLGKTPTLSLNSTANCPSSSACAINNTTLNSNNSLSPNNNLVIMSSSIDVSTPSTIANVSPASNNNTNNENNHKSSNGNNGGQKFETGFGGNASSPCNSDGNNSQSLDESNGNNKSKAKNTGGVNLSTMDSSSRGERDSVQNSLLRQNSAGTNSCSVQFNESSPNNGDSSNSSSNTSHVNGENNNKSNDEEKLNNQTTKNNTTIKEEERDKSSTVSNSSTGNASSNVALQTQTSLSNIKVGLSATGVKDEKEMIKKEETSLSSPNMSPVGFGSIVGAQINECNDNSGSTSNKSNDSTSSCDKRAVLPVNACNENDETSILQSAGGLIAPGNNLNLISNCNALNTNTHPLNSKSSLDNFCSDRTTSTTIASNTQNTPCNIPLNASFIINNLNANGPSQGGGGGVGNQSNLVSGGGSGINNCMEYMQQQNHIFVFSTQLANKGADAVLSGQFPTIIAYHCTQPATKSFFEDFFLKNPMKMTKLQRQNSLNIMAGMPTAGGPGSGGQPPWLTGNCNAMGKITHKLALNKSETITSSSNSTGSSVLSENDMMCWDQARSVMDTPSGESTSTMKMLENVENTNSTGKPVCSNLSNDESGSIPSLQGVKVPDENLTPQQRQHREEQLAKLKKMNQFLFPENGNDFHPQGPGNNPMMAEKLNVPPDGLGGNAGMSANPVALMGMQGPNIGNKHNATSAMRNIPGNIINHTKAGNISNTQLDNMPNLGEDIIMSSDIMAGSGCGPNEINTLPTNLKQGCMPNMNNTGGMGGNGSRCLINAAGSNLNLMNNNGPMGMPPGGLINDPNNAMISNTSDVLSPFNTNHCTSSGQEGGLGGSLMGSHKNLNASLSHSSDINSGVGMPQMEWSKLHHHAYEERLKNNHSNANGIVTEIGTVGGSSGCQQTLTRSNSTGVGGGGGSISHRTNSNTNGNNRSNQGPPPPYHPTQRSASVPIATQSPSSPNNPTSNMSLPSPRTSNTMGGGLSSTTSPSMDATPSSSSASTANTNSTTTTTTAIGISSSGNSSASTNSKNTFSQQGSPTPGSATGNSNRNRSSVNNLNSNPTTPLCHVSPKDIDSKNINLPLISDHKPARPNSQISRSPLLNDVSNNAIESRFPSPGLNFTPSSTSGANSQNVPNSFKNQNSSLERQSLQQVPPQFCRRTDNMPLNPNSNRCNQTKMCNAFDPISSLAQMSQQLTGGGVGLNSGGVGNSPNNVSGLMGGPGGLNDINMNGLMGGQMMGGPVDPSIDHCNQNPNGGGNMSMSGLGTGAGPGSVPGPFGPGNCNMMGGNSGPICQRLLNPKICGPNMSGGFNSNQIGSIGMRDGTSGFSGMMSHRMMNHRMSANFGNFNVSPNIQVKASTPNTIQYMPVRPQNNNTNSNMRVPPSLEFLQRYANPQIIGNSGGSQGASSSDMSAINGPNDLNKMPNTNNNMGVGNPNAMNQMNYFGNCNQMSAMGGIGQPVGGNVGGGGVSEQEEMQGIMSNHDAMNIPGPHAPMLRGMRPMRQGGLQSGVGINSGSRMQHPSMSNIPPPNSIGGSSFPNNDGESLDCNDPTIGNLFNNPVAAGLYQQQKTNKPPPMGMSHGPPNLNPNNSNNAPLPNNNVINEQNPSSNSIQHSVMIGPNSSMLNSNIPGSNTGGPSGPMPGPGNMGYKQFVGPTSNDLKYAQQYHSFQQQLYATSTRNQQPAGGQQQPPNAMSPSNNANAGFFVNK